MRIVCPLPSDYAVTPLLRLGIKEFYFGYIPPFWSRQYSLLNSINRRYTLQDQSQSKATIKRLTRSGDLRMYMALNAPLYATRQIVGILKMLDEFVHSGLNGVIVADLGLLFAVKERFPVLDIHVSSVVVCHNAGMVRFLAQTGVLRVILSRSMTIPEIAELRRWEKNIEFEAMLKNTGCFNVDGLCTHHHPADMSVAICDKERCHIPRENVYSKLFYLFRAGVDCVKIVDRGASCAQLLKDYKATAWAVHQLNVRKQKSLRQWVRILQGKVAGGERHSV